MRNTFHFSAILFSLKRVCSIAFLKIFDDFTIMLPIEKEMKKVTSESILNTVYSPKNTGDYRSQLARVLVH